MRSENYFYNCSRQYLDSIISSLYDEIIKAISQLPKRNTQSELNADLFWLLSSKGWSYDSTPTGVNDTPPKNLFINETTLDDIKKNNVRDNCMTSTTLEAKWHSDFANIYNGKLVQLEVQFGKVESMFKDFCGFKIARHERRLELGIEIVMSDPVKYFSHRKGSVSGMAYYQIAQKTLPSIGFDCPIWLIGIK
jgi:hypothetical protein